MNKHRGFTLLEMTLVSVVSVVVVAIAVAATGLMISASSLTQRQMQTEESLERLAAVFRDDAHRASEVTIPEGISSVPLQETDRVLCQFRQGNTVVRYRVSGGLLREEVGRDGSLRRDMFLLDRRSAVSVWTTQSEGKTGVWLKVTLKVADLESGKLVGKERLWCVFAHLGRDAGVMLTPEASSPDGPNVENPPRQ